MKALLCETLGGPEALVIREVPDPQPGPGEVVVDVRCAALNFLDTLIIRGLYQVKPPLPFIPGGEAAGVVAAVGDGVSRTRPGDRVIAPTMIGALAGKVTVPEARLLPMPPGMSYAEGAGFTAAYATSHYALYRLANVQPGQTLVVLGAAGGVGLTAVELGAVAGATVIAAASNAEKLAVAAAAGAAHGIDYTRESLKDRIRELTDGRGADIVYDPVGGAYTEPALRALAWGGCLLVVGFAAGDIPSIPLNLTLLKGVRIQGVYWGGWLDQAPGDAARAMGELLAMYADGKLHPHVGGRFAFDDHVAAFEAISERRARGKIVVDVSTDA